MTSLIEKLKGKSKTIKNPYIIHYLAIDKPWNLNTKQNTYEYFKYLKLSII